MGKTRDLFKKIRDTKGTFHATHTHTHTQKSLSHVRLFVTPWIVAHQAPRSMGFSRQEYWSGFSELSYLKKTRLHKAIHTSILLAIWKQQTSEKNPWI